MIEQGYTFHTPQYKPCPFCGAPVDNPLNLVSHADGRWQQIVCGACGARGPEVKRCLPFVTAMQSWDHRAAASAPLADSHTVRPPTAESGGKA